MAKIGGNPQNLKPQRAGEPSHNPLGRKLSVKAIAESVGENITPAKILNELKKLGIPPKEKKIKQVLVHVLAMKGLGAYPDADVSAIKEWLDRSDGKAEQTMKIDANIRAYDLDLDQLKKDFYANLKKRDS